MSDTYQAVYDAVRSRITNADVGRAIEEHLRLLNLGHYAMLAGNAAVEAANEHARPCVLFRPTVSVDGNKWCALYGPNLAEGVTGYGDSPAGAMLDFDRAWFAHIKTTHLSRSDIDCSRQEKP